MAGASVDWVLKEQVERDICLLYHQLADYSYIMGDLSYGSVFGLPYWEYLDFPGLDTGDREFLRDGCLVMILAMACEKIDLMGWYINPHIAACREAVARVACEDEDTTKLVRAVRLALDMAEQVPPTVAEPRKFGPQTPEMWELSELSDWVHRRYVRGYFRSVAQEFESHPYFRESHTRGPASK
jgi:hypothetical protein